MAAGGTGALRHRAALATERGWQCPSHSPTALGKVTESQTGLGWKGSYRLSSLVGPGGLGCTRVAAHVVSSSNAVVFPAKLSLSYV